MKKYNAENVTFLGALDESWNDEKFTKLGKACNLKTMNRSATRENLARAFAITGLLKFEQTFDKDLEDVLLQDYGQELASLLELAAGEVKKDDKNMDKKKFDVRDLAYQVHNHSDSCQIKDFELVENAELYKNDPQKWAQNVLDYVYYSAVRKLAEESFPDINYNDLEQVKVHSEERGAYGKMIQDIVQISDGAYGKHLQEKFPDFKELKNGLETAALVENAIRGLGTELSNPPKKKEMLELLQSRMVIDMYGEKLAGMTRAEAEQHRRFKELAGSPRVALEILESWKWDKEEILEGPVSELQQEVMKYAKGEPTKFNPIIVKDQKPFWSPAYDKRTPKLDIGKVQEQYAKGQKEAIFDELFAEFPDDPAHNTEPAVKRIYIDGKNAYDLFKGKYKGNEAQIQEAVKAEIVDTLLQGKHHVEMARMVQNRMGEVKAFVVPVRADLTELDKNKKWYQHSLAKQEERLWAEDKGGDARREDIAKEAESRHSKNFYNRMLDEMNAVRREFMGTDGKKAEFLEAERRMKAEPERAREWTVQKTAERYNWAKRAPEYFTEKDYRLGFEAAEAGILAAVAMEGEFSNCNFKDTPAGRQFKHCLDMADRIIAMDMPKELEGIYEFDELKGQREVFQKRWDQQDKEAAQNPLSPEAAKRVAVKRKETLDDLRVEAGERMRKDMIPFAEMVARATDHEIVNQIVGKADNQKLRELDAHFIGTENQFHQLDPNGLPPQTAIEAYQPFDRVRLCNERVMETVTRKIMDEMNYESTAAVYRNQFRGIRDVMETMGISQQEVENYGQKLAPEQKARFDQIRAWEKNLVRQDDHEKIKLPEGISSEKEAAGFILDIYKNAYYDKMGYENRMNPKSMEQLCEKMPVVKAERLEKRAVTFEDIAAKAREERTQKDVRSMQPRAFSGKQNVKKEQSMEHKR